MCRALDAEDVTKARLIDATPIGANVRSTVATYSNVLDDLRRLFAATSEAQKRGRTLKDFSYNTGALRCPVCDGTGQISARRAVPARRGHRMRGVPRLPLRARG